MTKPIQENVQSIPIKEIQPFRNHPFTVADNEDMAKIVESIGKVGTITPLLARPLPDGGYELISGHRRLEACRKLGLESIPVIVREMTDDEAVIAMVDANLQREHILPSEKAFAYKMKLEAMKHQGKTSCQFGTKLRTDELIAENSGESARQIQRYIRLTNLIPQLLKMVDEERIAFSVGVELSYLSEYEQQDLLEAIELEDKTPSLSQAIQMKKLSQSGRLDSEIIEKIISQDKPNQREKISFQYFESKRYKFKDMKPEVFTKYFVFLSQHGKSNGKGGLSYKTVKNIRGVLSSAYEYALENRYVNENPVLRSRMPSFPHSIKKDVPEYNAQQVRKLLLYAKEHESHIYIFLLLALYTGLRKGELLALTWDDVDYDKKLLRVNKSRTGSRKDVTMQITTPKTASSNRKIPLNDTVLEALKEEKQRQEDYAKLLGNGYDKSHNFIVRTVLGKPYVNLSAINRVVNRLTENAGLPHCTIHGFRHSVASILDDNGVPIQDISVLLGHESVQTTERIYINRRKTAKETTINALDSAINLNIA